MGFETKVLNVVDEVLGGQVFAKFEYGTLFVECTPRQAAKLESALIESFVCGVIVSAIEEEFAFDFV